MRRAKQAFYEYRISHTKGGTGVLIFISLFERMVVILGDRAISSKFKEEDFEEVKSTILSEFRKGNYTEGLVKGIERLGEKLAEHFPIQEGDENELPNQLEIILWE